MPCHNCGSDKTEVDNASGISVCVNCGIVLEENRIVSEVGFAETSGGKAVVQGSYAGESGRISGGGLFGRNRSREGQEQAIENGRLKISSLAHAVHLPERYRDSAQRYYNLAVVNRFTRGRRSDFVAAVCLYAVCRTEKSSHMLIDFSDILQVNVFTLGATFLKLCRVLNLTLPHVDPSLYISRFAVALDFGDYTQRVAQDAVRIAQRMDRDWITSGRRPAGICGACLLIAARMNGFRRTTREMIFVVKVADITIQKRLNEFNQTESAQLSVRDFRTIWLENRADPPSFQKNRKSETSRIINGDDDDNASIKTIEEDEEVVLKPAPQKRKRNLRIIENDDEEEVEKEGLSPKKRIDATPTKKQKSPVKRDKGKKADRTSQQDKDYYVEGSEDELLSDDEVVGPFVGHQADISEADNGAPESEIHHKNTNEQLTEEQLIQKQIEDSLNSEIKEIADTTASLTAEAEIKSEEEDLDIEGATQFNSYQQDDDLEIEGDTLLNSYQQDDDLDIEGDTQLNTQVDENDPDIITIKDPHFDTLTTEEKRTLTSIAKAKVANEVAELLNPNLQEDAQEIAEDMEKWLGDKSINDAATEIEKTKRSTQKSSDGKERDDEEEEADDEEEEIDDGNLSDVDDEEIEAMILDEREVALKTKIWYNANKEYLEEMAVRRMVEKDKGYSHRRGKGAKKKKMPPPSTPAEAAKQLMLSKKLSKKINQAVFDDMFESAESIAKIKQRDVINKITGNNNIPSPAVVTDYEVVEEPGDIPDPNAKKTKEGSDSEEEGEKAAAVVEEEDDEEMDSDDMADDERLLRDARAKYTFGDDDDDQPEYYDEDDY